MRVALRRNTVDGQQGGLAGWLLTWFRMPLRERFACLVAQIAQQRAAPRMELVEVLALGGKRHLMLVVCDGQRYLVGAGGDAVQTIIPVGRSPAADAVAVSEPLAPGAQGSRIRLVAQPGAEDVGCGP